MIPCGQRFLPSSSRSQARYGVVASPKPWGKDAPVETIPPTPKCVSISHGVSRDCLWYRPEMYLNAR
jgi:hypothetical protein